MRDALRTLYAGVAAVGLTGLLSPLVALLAQKDEKAPDPVLRFWARSLLGAAGVRLLAKGLANVPTGENFILVVNHQSHFDPLVLFAHLPQHLRYVAKADLFEIPIFGAAMRAAGNIRVARDGGRGDRERMAEAVTAVRERVSIVFFAEGTRSEDGVLRPFKKGAAVLAIEAQVPIVPAALAGTGGILPKGALRIRAGLPTALVVGRPLSTVGRTLADREALTLEAHRRVAELLEEGNRMISG